MLLPRDPEHPLRWQVRSASDPDVVYDVRVRDTRYKRGEWWNILYCDCMSEQRNMRVCWHKALVYLYWQACRRKGRCPPE